MLQNIINFYKNCYITDRASGFIRNIFSQSIENTFFLDKKDELSSGFLPYQPVEEKYANEIAKKLTIAEKEKELVFCTFFVIANVDGTQYCSPLFVYPAQIIKVDDLPFIEIDKEHRSINTAVFSEIVPSNIDFNSVYEQLYNALLRNDIQVAELSNIAKILQNNIPDIEVDAIFTYPNIITERELRKIAESQEVKDGRIVVLPASCIAITRKSINTRGIINELDDLSKINNFSDPLLCVFGQKTYNETKPSPCGYYPALLSQSQQNIIRYTSAYPFSVIIGPPGTGKSFTIANLAIEKMSTGKSVLIASGTDKAVDIIAEKIALQLDMPDIVVRAGRKEYKKQLIDYLESILFGASKNVNIASLKKMKRMIEKTSRFGGFFVSKNLNRRIDKYTRQLDKFVLIHQRWGEFLNQNNSFNGFWANLKKKNISRKLKKQADLNFYLNQINQQTSLLYETTRQYLKAQYQTNLQLMLTQKNNQFTTLLKALRTNRGTKREELFAGLDFDLILKVFPIWLVKMSDISQALPLVKELFDYVIIDEATQCDIASSIPIIQRGKRLIITGDPKQLRHFSFLAEARQRVFRQKFNLQDIDTNLTDYKNNSLLDLVINNCKYTYQFHYLDEHFRSLPAIIGFSNKKFYNNRLRIMTARPDIAPLEGIEIIRIDGKRLKNGTNPTEAKVCLEILRRIIDQQSKIPAQQSYSIGVISPFTDQVEYLRKQIEQYFNLSEIQKHRLSIETPYGFQGDERDVILLSFAVDNESNNLAFRYMNKEDVFNVSITRARQKQYIITSVNYKNLNFDNLLRQYLEYFDSVEMNKNQNTNKDEFARQVIEFLESKGYRCWENYEIAGINVDIVYNKDNQLRGVDLVGYPGVYNDAFGVERYKILLRAGLSITIVSFADWKLNNDLIKQIL